MVGVVAALDAEARTLGRTGHHEDGLSRIGTNALLAVSGMGPAAAAAAARRLLEAGAAALMSFGLAGGLDPSLEAGSIVLPWAVENEGGLGGEGDAPGAPDSRPAARLATDRAWRSRLESVLSAKVSVAGGILLSSAVPIDSIAAKAAAFRRGAVAVDMESFAVGSVAGADRIPFVVLRAVVDTARDLLPRAVLEAGRDGRVSVPRLVRGLLCAPRDLPAVLRLSGSYRRALRSLTLAGRLALA